MRYTISALATGETDVRHLVECLVNGGIERGRIAVSPSRVAPTPGKPQQTLVAVKTTELKEAQRISDTLRAGGGRAVQTAEDSSALNAV